MPRFPCPHCQTHLTAQDDQIGKTCGCPVCRQMVIVPPQRRNNRRQPPSEVISSSDGIPFSPLPSGPPPEDESTSESDRSGPGEEADDKRKKTQMLLVTLGLVGLLSAALLSVILMAGKEEPTNKEVAGWSQPPLPPADTDIPDSGSKRAPLPEPPDTPPPLSSSRTTASEVEETNLPPFRPVPEFEEPPPEPSGDQPKTPPRKKKRTNPRPRLQRKIDPKVPGRSIPHGRSFSFPPGIRRRNPRSSSVRQL